MTDDIQDLLDSEPETEEDRQIIQPDGSRACVNFELASQGFHVLNLRGDVKCRYAEKYQTLVYCNKPDGCKFRSKYQIPYANNGQVTGRKFSCMKALR